MANEGGSPKRFWTKHKAQAGLRLLGGKDIEHLSRELGVTPAALSEWRDAYLEGGESGLISCSAGESVEVERLQSELGEQAMEIELLREKIARMEQNRPLARSVAVQGFLDSYPPKSGRLFDLRFLSYPCLGR